MNHPPSSPLFPYLIGRSKLLYLANKAFCQTMCCPRDNKLVEALALFHVEAQASTWNTNRN